MQPPCVSVVVPTYNRSASLRRLLDGLARQTYPSELFEVVVVDDGSVDGSFDLLCEWTFPFKLRVLQQEHGGPAQARNLGVANAGGQLIVFVDDDVVPARELLDEHVRSHTGASDLVVVGPMSPPCDWRRPAWVRWEETTLQGQYRDMLAGKYPCTPRQFYTANVSLTRQRFMAAGGFDVTFKRAEDVELAFRLRDLGARFRFNPNADVMHYASRTFAAWLRIPYQYGRYDVIMARDKGQETMQLATHEFHGRHPLTQWMARACVDRPKVLRGCVLSMGALVQVADFMKLPASLTSMVLSGLFNVMYWQGSSDELGGRSLVFAAIAEGGRMTSKPKLVADEAPTPQVSSGVGDSTRTQRTTNGRPTWLRQTTDNV